MPEGKDRAPARGATHKRTVIVLDADMEMIAWCDVTVVSPADATFDEASDAIGQLMADIYAATHPEWEGVVAVCEDMAATN